MKLFARSVLVISLGCLAAAQTVGDDPVLKARSQRAAAQGIQEGDLPPVPRSVMEPPPLPPPEIHAKDLPQPRVAKPARTAKRGKVAGRAGRRGREAAAEAEPAPVDKQAAAKPGKRARASAGATVGKRARAKAAPSARSRAAGKAGRKGKA